MFIRVSGVKVDRDANTSDSGKQVWALKHRRTAFLYGGQEREGVYLKFMLIDGLRKDLWAGAH